MPEQDPDQPPDIGRRAVRAAFVLAVFGWGVGFYGPPIYLATVLARTGWDLRLASAAVTVHFLAGTPVIAQLPRLHTRFGLPWTTTLGAAWTTAGVLGWSLATQPWQLLVAAVVSGTGWVTLGAVPINAIVSRWYVARRPTALARAYNGATLGGVVFTPLWAALIGGLGFTAAVAVVGVSMVLAVAWMSHAVFSLTPEPRRTGVDRPAVRRPSWRDRALVTLAIGMASGLFAQIGLLAHLFELLTPLLGGQRAGFLLGFGTACAIVGRSAAAWAAERLGDRRRVAAASYGLQAAGALALCLAWPGHPELFAGGIALFGAGIGNATSLPPLIAQAEFAAAEVPLVVARIVALSQATYAFAPLCFGLLLGASAGPAGPGRPARVLLAAAMVIQLGAAAVFLIGRRRGPSDPAPPS